MIYTNLVLFIIFIALVIVLFLLGRFIVNWYFRINKIVLELEKINHNLKSIYKQNKEINERDHQTGKEA
jgi:predicted PurR-regulated permease PerM